MAAKQYRQIAHRLRVQRGPGNPDYVSERPRHIDSGRYLDLEDPTLCSFDELCQVDVPRLLRMGAIEELPAATKAIDTAAPRPKAKPRARGKS